MRRGAPARRPEGAAAWPCPGVVFVSVSPASTRAPRFVPMSYSHVHYFSSTVDRTATAPLAGEHMSNTPPGSVGSHPRSMPCLLQEHTHGTPDSHTRNHSIEARGRDPDEFAGEQAITPRVCRCRRDSRLGTRPRGQSSLHPWLPWPLPFPTGHRAPLEPEPRLRPRKPSLPPSSPPWHPRRETLRLTSLP